MTNIPAKCSALLSITLALAASAPQAANLNKCIDAYGKVTYSNLPCKGARQVRTVEIDPAPPVPPPSVPKVDMHKSAPADAPDKKTGAVKLETFGAAAKKNAGSSCDTLTDKLGRVLDKMDAARRKGYTQKQMDDWKLDIQTLERKKQQAGCF